MLDGFWVSAKRVSQDTSGTKSSRNSPRTPAAGGRIGAVCGFLFGLSAVLTRVMDLGSHASKAVHQLCSYALYVCGLSSCIGFVAGLMLWTYTPLGREKFAYRPPKSTLSDRITGAAKGCILGIFIGTLGSLEVQSPERVSENGLSGYAFEILGSCVICSLLGFVLPHSLPGP
jgi:hypothetical protein